ncbi:hypothetical protein PHMEG_00029456 [Phytophthora megakarya]|uniref:C2H2-type domain-containing protein n=1 Tax=Phytophthora megakarya TaxID=4795 RepID=A0A225V3K7_9STRA|nr:hypothetical protein PHMEG_00029456 [Phytophthora megakarya]
MFAYELEGLKRLHIRAIKWGSTYRVLVRGKTGKMVYLSNLSRPSNLKLVAKQYKVSLDNLKKHLSSDYKTDPHYRFYKGNHMESHLYEGIQRGEFYDKLENVLESQKSAYKVNIALGYDLISKTDDSDTRYYHPNLSNTSVFDTPVAINSRSDVRKVISEIRSMDMADKLNYPSSGYQVKAITGFKIYLYHREHALGDSEAVIPKIIRDNKSVINILKRRKFNIRLVINFLKTNNKCVFHCIAFQKHNDPKKDPQKIQSLVKEAFKQYCPFKGITYTLGLYRTFKPIDILQFDELEECFQVSINVFTMDIDSGKYESINILSHANHALYIKNIDMLQRKYQCVKCGMVFASSERLKNHTKNKCEFVNVESFPAGPTIYQPPPNTIRSMLNKYSIKNVDQYPDHFIVYDFEAILKPTATKHGENTVFVNEHIPVSVSVADSLTEEEMFDYIEYVGEKIQRYNVSKYEVLLRKIIDAHGLSGMEIQGARLGIKYTMVDINDWIKAGDYASFFDFHSKLGFGKQRSDNKKLRSLLTRYDINLIKSDLFAMIGADSIKSVIKNPSYMCIATSDMKMLDISNYVPAGKGIFPYEYITSFSVLSETNIPPKSAFDSKLRDTSISDDDYKRVQFVWEHYQMKSIRDLLVWYNNLDVVPFIKAIKAQRELFKRFNLDMFTDGVSLPGLSEKVMYQTCFSNLERPSKKPAPAFRFPVKPMSGYKSQNREFDVTLKHLDKLLHQQKYLCGLCYK